MKAWLLIISLLMTGHSLAETNDVYMEREALVRLIKQLEHLEPLADYAQKQADSERHNRFDYQKLKSDFRTIKAGIEHYLTTPLEPRDIDEELNSKYQEYRK